MSLEHAIQLKRPRHTYVGRTQEICKTQIGTQHAMNMHSSSDGAQIGKCYGALVKPSLYYPTCIFIIQAQTYRETMSAWYMASKEVQCLPLIADRLGHQDFTK